MPSLELTVNGTARRVEIDAGQSLLSVLRDALDLTGAKYGCGEGQCGACTVLVDGRPTRSCVTQAASVAGKAVTTVEGLEQDARLHPVQEAFLEADAMQCGYCTTGMIVEAAALLRRTPDPSEAEIARAMEGHVCRCCTYPRIVRAIRLAARAALPAASTRAPRGLAPPSRKPR
jgi:aerobic-type carbon monoxide dehydrogenase small subunit (CoxS/CutS family)